MDPRFLSHLEEEGVRAWLRAMEDEMDEDSFAHASEIADLALNDPLSPAGEAAIDYLERHTSYVAYIPHSCAGRGLDVDWWCPDCKAEASVRARDEAAIAAADDGWRV